MEVTIQEKIYTYVANGKEEVPVWDSFNRLAQQTFGLSFGHWMRQQPQDNSFVPHVLLKDGQVVANISANRMELSVLGQPRQYLQLGTVMTAPSFRNRGLSRFLMDRVLEEWQNSCDGVYLFANRSVLQFYPKFGFTKATEYRYSAELPQETGGKPAVRRLWIENGADRALLLQRFRQGNPFSALALRGNENLLWFYASSLFRENLYAVEDLGAAVVEYDGSQMICHDLYCGADTSLHKILAALARPESRRVRLGFTPREPAGWTAVPEQDEEDTLFLLAGKENIFTGRRLCFPTLSHT